MPLRDKTVAINKNEFLIVPRGVEHCPLAEEVSEKMEARKNINFARSPVIT